MKRTLVSILFFVAAAQADAAPTVLVTSFEPFFGARTNNSMSVSDALKSKLKAAGFNVETCLLPVVYDLAAARALECFKRITPAPKIVISLGEGACDLRIEDLMLNYDSEWMPDNAGNVRRGQVIIPGEVKQFPLTPMASRLYCSLNEKARTSVTVSKFAGGFVCNNTGFRLGLDFARARVPFGFVHVPNHNCNIPAAETASEITTMVAGSYKKPSAQCTAEFAQRAAVGK